ncbi:hypothetical protein FJ420_21530 [Mesorhizobium sp. B3-1-3]|uniref:hypothetical protein n=1 Tax=unclassified Mesorhizobium TaxID=325217 RepID=UPI00112CF8F1|nr:MULTISPECIES: hypothetical protein [unclassified Mesorhizobium]TPI59629.1 hypothetical protein FJ424_25315 [Mesorhizobium sp. B3-1-8]TPI67911.1 hypothetical protein FJ420_21530 [Mesorhizobium sp. B3-1-3]
MTLILTFASPSGIVQVGDRLVSASVGKNFFPLDEFSTKQIVYRASDAVVTIGYAGQALLGGVPTDEVIAAQLSGDPTLGNRRGRGRGAISMGGMINRWSITHAVRHLRRKLASQLSVGQELQLCIAGFKRDAGSFRPMLEDIILKPDGKSEIRHTPREWPSTYFAISAIGFDCRRVVAAVSERIKAQPPAFDQLPAFLTEQIRQFNAPGIGKDTSAITIPRFGIIESEFFPMSRRHSVLQISDSGSQIAFGVEYHPWVIGWTTLKRPTAGAGHDVEIHDTSGFSVRLKGTGNELPNGLLSAFSSVPRFNQSTTLDPDL